MLPRSRSLLLPSARSLAAARTYATTSDISISTNSVGGVKVAGVDFGQPTSSVSVVIKGGSRYESLPGVAHALKNFAFKATKSGSALKTVRETELYGGVLSSGLTREHLFLNAEFLRGDEEFFVNLLASVLSSTKFHPHEFQELVLPIIQSDTLQAAATPSVLALDIAHQLAFRRGLGNSLFVSPHSPLSVHDVKSYASKAFAKSNIAVFGTGISTDDLSKAVGKAFGSGTASTGGTLSGSSTKYYGGEQRIPLDLHSGAGHPTMIIAFGSTGTASPDMSVIPHLLGGESALKWVPGTSPLSLAAEKVPGSKARSFVLPYSDASLVGVEISAPTSQGLNTLAKEVVSAVKSVGSSVKEEDLKKAIAGAKFTAASVVDSKEGLLASYGPQVLSSSNSLKSLDEIQNSLGNVSSSSLGKAVEELFKGKATVVAIGDLAVLPYADELGL